MYDSHSTHGHHHAETVPEVALEVEAQQQVDEAAQEELSVVGQAQDKAQELARTMATRMMGDSPQGHHTTRHHGIETGE